LNSASGKRSVCGMRRGLVVLLVVGVACGVAAWHWQSEIIGRVAGWYLGRVARAERASGDLTRRRESVARFNRMLLMPPPADALVPELFDLATALSSRVATGEVSLEWAAYIYTDYQREMVRDRPDGMPRRSPEEVAAQLGRYLEFFSIRKRPDVPGVTVGGLLGTGDDVITLDEIEEAERTGRTIDLRTRGARSR
jgi:hypothetical protein